MIQFIVAASLHRVENGEVTIRTILSAICSDTFEHALANATQDLLEIAATDGLVLSTEPIIHPLKEV